jgi:hypothetical protein
MILSFLIGFGLAYIISFLFMKAALHTSVIATGFGAAFYAIPLHEGKIILIVILTVLFSFIIWGLVYFFKGLLMGLKGKNHFLWIPLFAALAAFVCIPPAFVFAELFIFMTQNIGIPYQTLWALMIGIFFAYRAYKQFDLLNDYAPHKVFGFYKAGVDLVI